ncbi:39S ribosomal protein L34, mitochondrial [Ostrinia furnacalis]|uniref:39S ribosomal protein L34, mitochondrial n=1 Tax=Ostrinia furnacalis TaxID=93504 RepID=UPI00103D79BD|nr:39S ribosomal protein L34, mitochondrial [Ostrinia furnacalis]
MSGLMSAILQPLRFVRQSLQVASSMSANTTSLVQPECFSLSSIRNKVRCYFPRPNEVRRVRRHGWNARMSTPNGRKIIMRRILKGKYVLSH